MVLPDPTGRGDGPGGAVALAAERVLRVPRRSSDAEHGTGDVVVHDEEVEPPVFATRSDRMSTLAPSMEAGR